VFGGQNPDLDQAIFSSRCVSNNAH
jgi:hypothetical protein